MEIHIKQNGNTILTLVNCMVIVNHGSVSITNMDGYMPIVKSLKYKTINRSKDVVEIDLAGDQ